MPNDVYEKRLTIIFYPLVNFGAPGGPLGSKFTSLGINV